MFYVDKAIVLSRSMKSSATELKRKLISGQPIEEPYCCQPANHTDIANADNLLICVSKAVRLLQLTSRL